MTRLATIILSAAGPGATIQDGGRTGMLRFGVTPAGPMDASALATANLALDNPAGAAAIEIGSAGVTLTSDKRLPMAFAGGGFRWTRNDQALPAAARVTLQPGETLRARAGTWGQWCYLAVPGGVDVPLVMGSRATHARSGIGGLEGRVLAAGDRLACLSEILGELDDVEIDGAWLKPITAPIGVVLGPQDDHFTAEAVETFLEARWRVTAAADRMAYALDGPSLAHARDFNIVSDGVALGAIQVTGDGRPLVLMADRQPTGGYPKIAHVRRADIGRLAQLRPGQYCRFAAGTPEQARRALLDLDAALAGMAQRLTPLRRDPTADRLVESNLIGGVTDGSDDTPVEINP